jgi:prolyl-tRNA editing enzyme YbaK/EbsC (Cys-tRNA(Pro) deacylase)
MSGELGDGAKRVQAALAGFGLGFEVIEFEQSTGTSAQAAAAIGCEIAQIAKSIVFRIKSQDRPLMVVASGANRIDEKKIRDVIGEKPGKADADFVRARTGYVIGGVPPLGHAETIETLIDEDLFRYREIWAAAGTPRAVFRLTPDQLLKITGGRTVSVA